MAFEYKDEERKHPKEYGGSPYKALMDEVKRFASQHRKHSLRRFAGMDADEPEAPPEAEKKLGAEDCEACKAGECDDPEHMSEDDKGGLEELLGDEKRSNDYE